MPEHPHDIGGFDSPSKILGADGEGPRGPCLFVVTAKDHGVQETLRFAVRAPSLRDCRCFVQARGFVSVSVAYVPAGESAGDLPCFDALASELSPLMTKPVRTIALGVFLGWLAIAAVSFAVWTVIWAMAT